MRRAALVFALAALPSAAGAADFCTDRPGLATGTCIVPANRFQLESALVSRATGKDAGVRTSQWTLGASVARFGLGGNGEIQLSWTPWTRMTSRGAGVDDRVGGIGDARIAYKALIVDGPTRVALLPSVKLPLARRAFGNRRVELGLLTPVDFTLGGGVGLTFTPEADWNADGDGHGHHLLFALAGGPGMALTDSLSGSLNLRMTRERDGGETLRQAAAGATLAWMARPNLQLDVEADTRIRGAFPDVQLIAGLSIRR
jgi:hypothetical protein